MDPGLLKAILYIIDRDIPSFQPPHQKPERISNHAKQRCITMRRLMFSLTTSAGSECLSFSLGFNIMITQSTE